MALPFLFSHLACTGVYEVVNDSESYHCMCFFPFSSQLSRRTDGIQPLKITIINRVGGKQ